MKILVRSPNWIGDQILSYPFFHYLRQAHPSAKITAVCVPWVEDVQFRNLVDDVHVLPRSMRSGFANRMRHLEECARELREKGPWDLGILLPNSLSSAWIFYRAGVKLRRGYAKDGRGFLLNQKISQSQLERIHRSEAYAGLLPARGKNLSGDVKYFWGVPPQTDKDELDPGIPPVVERFDVEKAWKPQEMIAPPEGPYWVLAPGSVAESRRYPAERYAALAREIARERGWPGLVVGGAQEAPLAQELCSDRTLGLKDFTARGPIPSLSRVFAQAKFTVTNDSGLAHVAALCGSRVQIVWGAGNPKITEPLGPGRVRTLFNPVSCWPCERNTCALPAPKTLQCLKGISPESVWEEIKR
jgi:heptosyltransferase-2